MGDSFSYSYWEKDSFLRPWNLVVVGAGIVGLSSAYFYKKGHPDKRVLVLDKGFMPEGASSRNAGFACVGSIGEHMADMQKEAEEEIRKRIKMRYEGLGLLRQTLGEEQIGYEACGGYELFTSSGPFEAAREKIPLFNSWMEELIGESNVYKAGKLNGYDVIENRLEGALHAGRMMERWIALAVSAGVEIRWNSRVSGISEGGVTLEGGPGLEAGQVLVASNGFTRRLLPDLQIRPARGYVMVTGELDPMPWKGTFHHDRGYIYFRHIGNRLLLGGARNVAQEEEETDHFGNNPAIKGHLHRFAKDILRLDSGWSVDYEWSGIMGFTESKTPIVEKLNDRLSVAAGLSGMGVAIGTAIGKRVSGLLSEA